MRGPDLFAIVLASSCAVGGCISSSSSSQDVPCENGSCSSSSQNDDSLGEFVSVPRSLLLMQQGGVEECFNADGDEVCEEFASEEYDHECLTNPHFMVDHCAKACYACFDLLEHSGETIDLPVGVAQRMDTQTAADAAADAAAVSQTQRERFYQTLSEMVVYMTEEVWTLDEFQPARKSCFNQEEDCVWNAASDEEFCDDPLARTLCGPACQSCGDRVLTDDELKTYTNCTVNDSLNAFRNENNVKDDQPYEEQQPQTINEMFLRIVGELPYPSQQTYPTPGVDYTAKILSRPSLDASIDSNRSLDSLDVRIGGPWIVVLDDFLTEEECDRLIELGNLLEWEKSTIENEEEDDDEDDDEDVDVDDTTNNSKKNKNDDDDEETKQWRTSATAWCQDPVCRMDPIAAKVQRKIGLTTGVHDESYYEFLQLLKYKPGQYYKEHHDEEPDHHGDRFDTDGPRVLTFFLYLNDVEDGGETRFTDVSGGSESTHPSMDVTPKKGRALLWPSMSSDDLLVYDNRTYHAAQPVQKGFKFAANAWLHLRPYRDNGCDEDDLEDLREKLLVDDEYIGEEE